MKRVWGGWCKNRIISEVRTIPPLMNDPSGTSFFRRPGWRGGLVEAPCRAPLSLASTLQCCLSNSSWEAIASETDYFDVDHFSSLYWICYNAASSFSFFNALGFLDLEACGLLVPHPGIEPALPTLEAEVLTTGSPGKSHERDYFEALFKMHFGRNGMLQDGELKSRTMSLIDSKRWFFPDMTSRRAHSFSPGTCQAGRIWEWEVFAPCEWEEHSLRWPISSLVLGHFLSWLIRKYLRPQQLPWKGSQPGEPLGIPSPMPWALAALPHHCASPGCLLALPQARAGTRVGPGAARTGVTTPPPLLLYPQGGGVLAWAGPRWSDAWGGSPRPEVPLLTAPSTGQEGAAEFCFSRLVSCWVHKCFCFWGNCQFL